MILVENEEGCCKGKPKESCCKEEGVEHKGCGCKENTENESKDSCCKEGSEKKTINSCCEEEEPVENSCCQENKQEDYKELAQRIQADFQNYKRRADKEKNAFVKFANKELIKKILPVFEHLALALENKQNVEEFVKGVEMIYTQLFEVLREQGLEPVMAVGQMFDPNKHEALLQVESDEPAGSVVEELQKGYKLGDAVLRHTKVKVSKGKTDGGDQGSQQQ